MATAPPPASQRRNGWLGWILSCPCPVCGARALAPLCRDCRADSAIDDRTRLDTAILPSDSRLAYLGLYWRASGQAARVREPTPLAHALHRFKFCGDRYAGHCLARLFAESLSHWAAESSPDGQPRYDAVVPIPLSAAGLGARRFNQSAWLARGLARRAHLAYRPGWLQRSAGGAPQRGLGALERRTNVCGVFSTGRLPRQPGRVLLIDDVCTTGSTLTAAATVLVDAGADVVDAAVLLLAATVKGER